MKPSEILSLKREAAREAAGRFRAKNLRVFGSASRGADREDGDLDLLVDTLPGATLFDLGGLQMELEELLGVRVDLLTPGDLPERFREMKRPGGAYGGCVTVSRTAISRSTSISFGKQFRRHCRKCSGSSRRAGGKNLG